MAQGSGTVLTRGEGSLAEKEPEGHYHLRLRRGGIMGKTVVGIASALGLMFGFAIKGLTAPGYDQGRQELEWVMERLIEWLPGAWDSFPQVWYERNVREPSQGEEHDYWHRTFVRIDAPQVGEVVFYGQINVGGRDGPMMPGSQVLYHAVIDERLGAVNIFGQGPLDPNSYEDLHLRPELWGKVQQRDPGAINCDWLWRRDGNQIFGVLQGNTKDKQSAGPGTCSFISKRTDAPFAADAEWVLTPEQLWLYDNNWSAGFLFLGREDQTHIKLYRARDYTCQIKDASGNRQVDAYDRGYEMSAEGTDGSQLNVTLLRAEYPGSGGVGLQDQLRLLLTDPAADGTLATADALPLAKRIRLEARGVNVVCQIGDD